MSEQGWTLPDEPDVTPAEAEELVREVRSAEPMTIQDIVVESVLDTLDAALADGLSSMLGLSDLQLASEHAKDYTEVTAYDDEGESLGEWRVTVKVERINQEAGR
jgi:pantothenate kinase type III